MEGDKAMENELRRFEMDADYDETEGNRRHFRGHWGD
jgi:hypothetical protein